MASLFGLARRRALPWTLLLDLALALRHRWKELPERDQRELGRIVRKSKGRPGNLNQRDRNELKRIVKDLDLLAAGRDLLPFGGGRRK